MTWNSLPDNLHDPVLSDEKFRAVLKTHFTKYQNVDVIVIFVNENENIEKRENNEFVNENEKINQNENHTGGHSVVVLDKCTITYLLTW